jgi:hypothetical protein
MSNANATFDPKSHRKTLAEQLDRLDGIIDALAAGLNETVADVVRQAVQQTLEGLVQGVLANPGLLRALAAQVMPDPPASAPAPQAGTRPALKRFGAWTAARLGAACLAARLAACDLGHQLRHRSACTWRRVRTAAVWTWEGRRAVGLALGVGVLAGVASFLAGPVPSALACGLSGAALTAAGRVLLPVWRLFSQMKGVRAGEAALAGTGAG